LQKHEEWQNSCQDATDAYDRDPEEFKMMFDKLGKKPALKEISLNNKELMQTWKVFLSLKNNWKSNLKKNDLRKTN